MLTSCWCVASGKKSLKKNNPHCFRALALKQWGFLFSAHYKKRKNKS